jgi:hypothetical protein
MVMTKAGSGPAAFEVRLAKRLWPDQISKILAMQLSCLVERHSFSVLSGDLQLLNASWYVTHSGLLRLATRLRCCGLTTHALHAFCDNSTRHWVFKAIVFKSATCKGFSGYGDADPSNVSTLVHGAEMRVAETRAVNRALRKAYGIGICSVEEIGSLAGPSPTKRETNHETRKLPPQPVNGNGSNGTRVRDRLCQIIRQHQLDPNLVKSYAVDFCGTKSLREATREQVENFVAHLADWAEKDRNALLCQLNGYMRSQEGVA